MSARFTWMTRQFSVGGMVYRALVALSAAALVAVGVAAAPAAQAASPTITLISLSPGVLEAGLPYTATLVVSSSASITVQDITVAVRTSTGANSDFPGSQSATIDGIYVYTSGAETFAAGTYSEFGSYEIDNTWYPFPAQTLTVTAAPSSTTPNPPPVGIPGEWTSTLNDGPGYSGGASVDTVSSLLTWAGGSGSTLVPPHNGFEDDCYNPANVTQDGSFVDLSLTKPAGGTDCVPPSGYDAERMYGAEIGSPFSQEYGAFEAEVYLPPAADGSIADWPAWWLDPTVGSSPNNWPNNGEIDLVEGLLNPSEACYHFHYGTPDDKLYAKGCDVNIGPGWHTFGVAWEPVQDSSFAAYTMTFYYDGVDVGTLQEPTTSGLLTPVPMNLYFDISHNISYTATVPATMQVAYARAWTAARYYYQYNDPDGAGCLGVASSGDAQMDTTCANSRPNEDWTWGAEYGTSGYYQLINDGSDTAQSCLSVHDSGTGVGDDMTGYTCKGTSRPDQYWKLIPNGDGQYTLENYHSHLYLYAAGSSVVQASAGNSWSALAG